MPARVRIGKQLPWLVAGVLALALIGTLLFGFLYLRNAPASRLAAVRALIAAPENAHLLYFNQMAVSPDGQLPTSGSSSAVQPTQIECPPHYKNDARRRHNTLALRNPLKDW